MTISTLLWTIFSHGTYERFEEQHISSSFVSTALDLTKKKQLEQGMAEIRSKPINNINNIVLVFANGR